MPTVNNNSPRRPWMPERKAFGGMKVDNGKFYRSAAWIKLRNAYRNANPLCVNVETCGNATDVVDHKVEISQGGEKLDWSNLQPMCHSCHNAKSGKSGHKTKER